MQVFEYDLSACAAACIKNGKRTAASKSITLQLYQWEKNQGRQLKKWMDNVNEDIEAKKLTVQQAIVLVWDSNKWKHQVAASYHH